MQTSSTTLMPITQAVYGKRPHSPHKVVVRRAGSRVFELIPDEQYEAVALAYPEVRKIK